MACINCDKKTIKHRVGNVVKGYYNYLNRTEWIEKVAAKRLEKCKDCKHKLLSICKSCGCPVSISARSPDYKCKEGYWDE